MNNLAVSSLTNLTIGVFQNHAHLISAALSNNCDNIWATIQSMITESGSGFCLDKMKLYTDRVCVLGNKFILKNSNRENACSFSLEDSTKIIAPVLAEFQSVDNKYRLDLVQNDAKLSIETDYKDLVQASWEKDSYTGSFKFEKMEDGQVKVQFSDGKDHIIEGICTIGENEISCESSCILDSLLGGTVKLVYKKTQISDVENHEFEIYAIPKLFILPQKHLGSFKLEMNTLTKEFVGKGQIASLELTKEAPPLFNGEVSCVNNPENKEEWDCNAGAKLITVSNGISDPIPMEINSTLKLAKDYFSYNQRSNDDSFELQNQMACNFSDKQLTCENEVKSIILSRLTTTHSKTKFQALNEPAKTSFSISMEDEVRKKNVFNAQAEYREKAKYSTVKASYEDAADQEFNFSGRFLKA